MKIDFSQIQTFADCPRRFYNRYVLGLRKVSYDERELDKDFGKCVHLALEILYKGGSADQAKSVFKEQYTGLEAEKAKTPQQGEKLIEAYANYWAQPTNDFSDANLKTLAVETVDSFKLTDEIEWLVKIDRIVDSPSGIWVMDHKTTRSIAYNYFWQFSPNMQVSGYCEYARQKYGQCSGAIINAISVGFRERAYKGNPAGFYCEFSREPVNRNKEQLEDFRHNALHWVERLNEAQRLALFPKNEAACHQFKGCSFRELCIACDDEEIRNTLYEKYDPLEYLKEK